MIFHGSKKYTLGAVMLVAAMGFSLPATATLMGDTITVATTANIPVDTWTDNLVVGAGIEMMAGDGSNHAFPGPFFPHLFSVGDFYDFGANSITINFAALGPGGGFNYAFQSIFSDLDWTDMPGTLDSVVLAGGATGLLGSNISGIHDNGFTFQGTVDLITGANFTLNLIAIHDTEPPPGVPAPATLALFCIGLAGLGWSRCKKA